LRGEGVDAQIDRAIAEKLGGLAIAFEQSVAYVNAQRITLGRYLEEAHHDKVLEWFDESVSG